MPEDCIDHTCRSRCPGIRGQIIEGIQNIKKRDLDFAFEIEDIIHKSPDPDVRYKDSRPIMDLKHMIEIGRASCRERV